METTKQTTARQSVQPDENKQPHRNEGLHRKLINSWYNRRYGNERLHRFLNVYSRRSRLRHSPYPYQGCDKRMPFEEKLPFMERDVSANGSTRLDRQPTEILVRKSKQHCNHDGYTTIQIRTIRILSN